MRFSMHENVLIASTDSRLQGKTTSETRCGIPLLAKSGAAAMLLAATLLMGGCGQAGQEAQGPASQDSSYSSAISDEGNQQGLQDRRSSDTGEAEASQQADTTADLPTPNFAELVEMDGAAVKEALSGYPSREFDGLIVVSNTQKFLDVDFEDGPAYHDDLIGLDTFSVGDWYVYFSPEQLSKDGEDGFIRVFIVGNKNISAKELAGLVERVFPFERGGVWWLSHSDKDFYSVFCMAKNGAYINVGPWNCRSTAGPNQLYVLELESSKLAEEYYGQGLGYIDGSLRENIDYYFSDEGRAKYFVDPDIYDVYVK